MIRLFKFRDLGRIMEIWLRGGLNVHPLIKEEHWRQNFEAVRSVLPNAEMYMFEEDEEVQGFIDIDIEYIAGIFIAEGHWGQGIGHQLISEVKRRKRLPLHVYEKNTGTVAFYQAGGFRVENDMAEKGTEEQEYLMVSHEDNELSKGT